MPLAYLPASQTAWWGIQYAGLQLWEGKGEGGFGGLRIVPCGRREAVNRGGGRGGLGLEDPWMDDWTLARLLNVWIGHRRDSNDFLLSHVILAALEENRFPQAKWSEYRRKKHWFSIGGLFSSIISNLFLTWAEITTFGLDECDAGQWKFPVSLDWIHSSNSLKEMSLTNDDHAAHMK